MQPPARPIDEASRLEALRDYRVLDTLPEQALDDLTVLAAQICNTPISLISLIDENRQWFKSTFGLAGRETPRELSFCGHAILEPAELFVIPDATADVKFADNPLVTGDPHIRFYAGAPLVTPDGHALGTLCVIDRVPRQLSTPQQEAMRIVARQVMAQLELRRRTRELIANEAQWLKVFYDGPTALAIHGYEDRRFVDVNAAFTHLFGWTIAEAAGKTTTDLGMLANEELAPIRETLRSHGALHEHEAIFRTKGGDHRDILVSTELVDLRYGRCTLTTYVDITPRKKAEAELRLREETLRLSEERYRALFEYAPDGILIGDSESRYLDANASMCRMLGYSREELIGKDASDIVVDEERTEIQVALHTIRAGFGYQREWRFRRKDGSTFAADVIATQMPDGTLLGMVRDATERNRATEALRAAEERMRFALEGADVGIWEMDYRTGVLSWSDILERQYGLAPGTFAGTYEAFLEHVYPDDRAELRAVIDRAMASGSDFRTEHRSLWPDGTIRWLNGAGRMQVDGNGAPVRAVGISMDVTEKYLLEHQYQQAQKMEAVGRLAGGVAHDFNNLLTAILGYCELLLAGFSQNDPRRDDMEEIQKASLRAASLTRQLLAFSRKQIIEPTILDINDVIADMQSMLERLIGEHVKIDFRLGPLLRSVKVDRGQFEQIVLNLAVNARDAMAHGGTLTIETANVDVDDQFPKGMLSVPAGRYVLLAVTDTGAGMSADVQTRLFEPFFTTKDVGKGTGLGLATVHGIVTQSGGAITVDSEIGHGTCFRIYLPQAEGSATGAALLRPADDGAGQRHDVLVVEDADALRHLTKRLLERLGHRVVVAANADEARQVFQQHPEIDVLLTDVIMPGDSGPDLARHLLSVRPTLKVVYMSGYTEDAIVHHGILEPGIAFLHKPFSSESLSRKIREAVAR